jgi:hypothetical protein
MKRKNYKNIKQRFRFVMQFEKKDVFDPNLVICFTPPKYTLMPHSYGSGDWGVSEVTLRDVDGISKKVKGVLDSRAELKFIAKFFNPKDKITEVWNMVGYCNGIQFGLYDYNLNETNTLKVFIKISQAEILTNEEYLYKKIKGDLKWTL